MVACTGCGQTTPVGEDLPFAEDLPVGQEFACPYCGTVNKVPGPRTLSRRANRIIIAWLVTMLLLVVGANLTHSRALALASIASPVVLFVLVSVLK